MQPSIQSSIQCSIPYTLTLKTYWAEKRVGVSKWGARTEAGLNPLGLSLCRVSVVMTSSRTYGAPGSLGRRSTAPVPF